jgi:hypothetical protein
LDFGVRGHPNRVPFYCCDDCGWATTAFRVDAVREHQIACPSCAGAMRIAFQVEEPPWPDAVLPTEPESEPTRAVNRSLRRRVERRGRPSRIESLVETAIRR